MKFTVVWDPEVHDDLADLWMNAENRDEIRLAADTIDVMLVEDANRKGLPFTGGGRVLACYPVAVTFSVSIDDRSVRITEVWVGGHN